MIQERVNGMRAYVVKSKKYGTFGVRYYPMDKKPPQYEETKYDGVYLILHPYKRQAK